MLLLGCFTCLNFILKAWLNLIRWLHEQQMNCVFLLFRGMQPRSLFYMEILIVRAHSRVRFQHTEEVSSPKSLKRKWLPPTMKLHWTFTMSNKDIVLKKKKKGKKENRLDKFLFAKLRLQHSAASKCDWVILHTAGIAGISKNTFPTYELLKSGTVAHYFPQNHMQGRAFGCSSALLCCFQRTAKKRPGWYSGNHCSTQKSVVTLILLLTHRLQEWTVEGVSLKENYSSLYRICPVCHK